MTALLEQAFKEAQKLPNELQNEIAQQLLEDIDGELKWQETLSNPDIDIDVIEAMAQVALREDEEGKTNKNILACWVS